MLYWHIIYEKQPFVHSLFSFLLLFSGLSSILLVWKEGVNLKKSEICKRYLLFIVSLFFIALGIAFTKHGELGLSPISSVANVLNLRFSFLSIGNWLIVWNCVLIVGQILILRRKFNPVQLLQLPLSFLFGWFTDLGMIIVSPIPTTSYAIRMATLLIGIVILGFGISLSVVANVIMNSGEAFVKAVSDVSGKKFGDVKIAFDIACVVLSVSLSLLFFHGKIIGTREGTVLSAVLTGLVVKFFVKRVQNPLSKILR